MRTKSVERAFRLCLATLLLLAGSAVAQNTGPSNGGITPIFVSGNINSCSDISNLQDGNISFSIDSSLVNVGTNTYTNPADGYVFTVTLAADGAIGWSTTFNSVPVGMDAVAVKGGNGFNAYIYDPLGGGESDANHDSGLFPPTGLCGGNQCGLSHLMFCYDYSLVVSKTANPSFTRTWPWTLNKQVSPAPLNLFNGDSGDVVYTVTATKGSPVDSNFAVSGTVTITNPAPFAATITAINDQLAGNPVTLNCGVSLPYALPSQQTLTCSYTQSVNDSNTRTNVVTVTTSGQVGGGTASATATFTTPTTLVDNQITVTDSDSAFGPWTFSASGSVNYDKTFDCSGQNSQPTFTYTFPNTVTASSGATATTQVVINCYSLAVTKTANTTFNRAWSWTIAKSYVSPALTVDTDNNGTPDALLLSTSQNVNLNYAVMISAVSNDNTYAVSGVITINNNNPTRSATLLSVIDVVSPALNMSVNCPSSTVPAGGSLLCTYSGSLPDGTARTNVATANQQNYHYASDGTATPAGSSPYSGMAAVTFGAPATLVDQCVNLFDAFNSGLAAALGGTICAPAAGGNFSQTLTYTASFTWDPSLGTCKTIAVPNTASFVTNTTQATGSNTATINITNQDCALGCTLTQGYWKTHSKYGPAAKSDPTWNLLLPNGPDTTFFYSGKTWYQAFWTTPAGGNAYWVLAHQYEAAVLNQLNGASLPSQVQTALNQAYSLFNNPTNTPAYIGGLKSSNALRQQFISLAAILDMYNNGNYPGGPAHCSEDSTSSSSP